MDRRALERDPHRPAAGHEPTELVGREPLDPRPERDVGRHRGLGLHPDEPLEHVGHGERRALAEQLALEQDAVEPAAVELHRRTLAHNLRAEDNVIIRTTWYCLPVGVAPALHSVPDLAPLSPRERILDTSYDLFSKYGVRAVGVDTIIEQSGVAKMTLYRHFRSKDELVLAFLQEREEVWTIHWLEASVENLTADPRERLLAIFDVFDPWFRRPDFEGCSFVNLMLEAGVDETMVRLACVDHLANIRDFLRRLATEAGAADPDNLACQWHILMKGSIVAAGEGDVEAARRGQAIGRLLLDSELG